MISFCGLEIQHWLACKAKTSLGDVRVESISTTKEHLLEDY